MAPKKTSELSARQSPRRDPEENESKLGDDEGFNPPLNHRGAEINPTFDPIVGPPTGKEKGTATPSAPRTARTFAAARDVYILENQARQDEQLRQLFNLVNSSESEIRSVVKAAESSSEQCGRQQRERREQRGRILCGRLRLPRILPRHHHRGLRQEVTIETGFKQSGLLPHRRLRHEDSYGL